MQLGMLLDVGLMEDMALFRVQSGGQPVDDDLPAIGPDAVGIVELRGDGVPIGGEPVGIVKVAQAHPFLDHVIMAQMQPAGGTHTA